MPCAGVDTAAQPLPVTVDYARSFLPVAALVLVLLGSLAWLDAGHHRAAVVVLTLTPLGFAAILLAVVLGPTRGSGWLRSRWLRILAVVSYSVYPTHTAMVPLAADLTALLPSYGAAPPLAQFLLFLPVFLALSVASGLALHLGIERPFLLLKDRVILR